LPAGEMDDGKEESDSDIMSVSDNEHSSEDGDQIDANGYIQKTKEGKKRAAVIKAVKEDEKWKADGIRRNARMQAIIEREVS
jgi:hypothetical protein